MWKLRCFETKESEFKNLKHDLPPKFSIYRYMFARWHFVDEIFYTTANSYCRSKDSVRK